MRILFIGDIFGRPGRVAVKRWLPAFRTHAALDFVIANAENVAGGKGTTLSTAQELFEMGVNVLTGGNHSFHHRESYPFFEEERRVLRPANLPPGTPGRGWGLYPVSNRATVAVINLMGRAFMKPIDCPFRRADELVEEARKATPLIIIDFHAEATSEKLGLAAYLDGRVSAIIGTHTHIPTADARVSAAGTAAITDVGMTGPYDSVIGIETPIVLEQLIRGLPVRHEVAKGEARICAVQLEIDENDGRAKGIELIQEPAWNRVRPNEKP